jgi:uncharacterized protein YjiS (DUF1127 family)
LCAARLQSSFCPITSRITLPRAIERFQIFVASPQNDLKQKTGRAKKTNWGRIALDIFLERTTMSQYLDGESVAAFAESRSFSSRAVLRRAIDTIRIWRKRQHEREELLKYLAMDHRAGTDLGIDRTCAREWAERPFWRA